MHKLLWILVGLLGLPCCAAAQGQPSPADTIATRLQLPQADCALFPAGARLPAWLQVTRRQASRFTPAATQAQAAEQALQHLNLLAVNPGSKTSQDSVYAQKISQRLGQYHRQYFGFYNSRKQPCLFINLVADFPFTPEEAGLRPTPPGYVPYWLQQYLYLGDGGDDHWSIYYNLATKKFYRYWHNLDLGGG